MNEYAWVSLIALAAWLILAIASYREQRIDARRTLLMATAWLGLFLLVAGAFMVFGG